MIEVVILFAMLVSFVFLFQCATHHKWWGVLVWGVLGAIILKEVLTNGI